MIEVVLVADIYVVKETLSRMGIANKKECILYPSCYLIEDIDNKMFVAHFKEILFEMGGYNNFTEDDKIILDSIAILLEEWELVNLINFPEEVDTVFVYTLPYSEKKRWSVKHKVKI